MCTCIVKCLQPYKDSDLLRDRDFNKEASCSRFRSLSLVCFEQCNMCACDCIVDTEELIPPQSKSEGNFMEGMQDEMRQNVTSYVSTTRYQMKLIYKARQSEIADSRPLMLKL